MGGWQPIHIHCAILGDTSLEAVSAAFGDSPDEAFRCWQQWAARQRNLVIAGKPSVTSEDYETVAGIFASAGIGLPDEERTGG